MKRIGWIIILLTGCTLQTLAQTPSKKYIITGLLKDSLSTQPLAYATINVIDQKAATVFSTYSLENGTFKVEIESPGKYKFEISSVGYKTKEVLLTVNPEVLLQKASLILVSPGNDVMQEIKVTARKRLVEQRPGMLVYNAESDITNKGGTAADVLRKAPVLSVDAQGNVSMRGSSNLKILINGKYSGQMARNAADALNMMPADMIKSVEVITTPSAKYDAEGAAGVINIITKKGKSDVSGTLEASVSNLEQMFNPRISLSGNKWSMNLAGHLHRLRRKESQFVSRNSFSGDTAINHLQQSIEKDNAAPHGSADLTMDYEINTSSELSLGINTWVGNWPEDSRMRSTVSHPGGNIIEAYAQNIDARSNYLGIDINLGYVKRFKQQGRQITLLAQNAPSRDISGYTAMQLNDNDQLLYQELNNSKTKNREWAFQADYIHPLNAKGSFTLEAGTKIILRNVGNRYTVDASDAQNPEEITPQPSRSDHFKYSQDVYAGYGMLKVNMKNYWYLEAGARLEATYIKGSFVNTVNTFDNNFLNFVPTATISKKLDEKNTLTLSYTKRLTRPYIWDLNPNANASDPKNIVSGNPQLQPEIAHQAELSYGLNTGANFFVNAALFWKQTNNSIIEFIRTDANGISYTSKQNLAGNRQFGLNLSSTANLTEKWTLNGNANVNYNHFKSDALEIFRSGWGTEVNINTTIRLPHYFALQAFGEYNTRMITLLGSLTNRYHYSFAGKKEIKKAKIAVTLAAVNIFSKYIPQADIIQRPDFVSRIDNRYYTRALKLTVNWEFGGMFQQKERKKINNNDVNTQGRG